MTTYSIYKITNLINNKCYIGQSINTPKRFREHKNGNSTVSKAIKKYGVDNFLFEVIYQTLDVTDIDAAEVYFIKESNSLVESEGGWGYNLDHGGRANNKVSEITKQRLKEYHSNRPASHNEKLRKPKSPEHIEKMRKPRTEIAKQHYKESHWSKHGVDFVCPHCGKISKNKGNMFRYHFDKCKSLSVD